MKELRQQSERLQAALEEKDSHLQGAQSRLASVARESEHFKLLATERQKEARLRPLSACLAHLSVRACMRVPRSHGS